MDMGSSGGCGVMDGFMAAGLERFSTNTPKKINKTLFSSRWGPWLRYKLGKAFEGP